MKRLIPILYTALLCPGMAFAARADLGFNGVVSSIEGQYHVRATHVPMMGFVNFMAFTCSGGGVRGMKVVEFDNFSADADALHRMVQEKLGEGWSPVVREHDRKQNEETFIFMHPDGKRLSLLVLDLEKNELDMVKLSIKASHWHDGIGLFK